MRGYPERPALVFLHFFGGSARTWDPVLEELQDFETLPLDLPGFGKAVGASGPYSVAAYADWVEDAVRACGIGDHVLIGHSMGGKIALALAARRPAGLSALVLLAPSPPTPEPIEEAMREKLIAGWGCYGPASETLAQVTAHPLEGAIRERTIADMMGASRNAWAAWLQQGSREDISGCMERIEAPVRILTGDCDTILPTQLIEQEVASRLASAQLATVPGAGHLLPLEAPSAVAQAIRSAAEACSFEEMASARQSCR
jgi:pimeloyl-ACP methyl ester carboxylesterase